MIHLAILDKRKTVGHQTFAIIIKPFLIIVYVGYSIHVMLFIELKPSKLEAPILGVRVIKV